MAVEEEVGAVSGQVLGDDDRLAGRFRDARLEADAFQIRGQPLRRFLALGVIGRIGGDRLETQQLEQALDRVVSIGIEMREEGGKIGH